VPLADYQVNFQVAKALFEVNGLRAVLNAHPAWDLPSAPFCVPAFSISFALGAQVLVQFTALALIFPDVLVDPLGTDHFTAIPGGSPAYLFRAVVHSQVVQDIGFYLGIEPYLFRFELMPALSFAVRQPGFVLPVSPIRVALNFAANNGFVLTDELRDLPPGFAGFQPSLYFVSLLKR
jgi:hypothetical protein